MGRVNEVQLARGVEMVLDAAHPLAVAQLLVLRAKARLAVRLRHTSTTSVHSLANVLIGVLHHVAGMPWCWHAADSRKAS